MWVVAGVLLGLVVLASLVGFHSGPHAQIVAGVAGILAVAWLALMAVEGRSAPVLWALLGADLAVSAGVSFTAWHALMGRGMTIHHKHLTSREGAEGIAVTDLAPQGIVRIRGEQWSAVSANGTVRAGTRVQVLRAGGVRLEVWGEEPEPGSAWHFNLDQNKERYT